MAPKKKKQSRRASMTKVSLGGATAIASFLAIASDGKGGNAVTGFKTGGFSQGIATALANISAEPIKAVGIPLLIGLAASFLPTKTLAAFGKFRVTT